VVGSCAGTPPRRRGGLQRLGPGAESVRSTPASAGRTTGPGRTSGPSSKHPRVGGEDMARHTDGSNFYEAPPRRRGGPHRPPHPRRHQRSTPASAGSTGRPPVRLRRRAKHPRVGGEDRMPTMEAVRDHEAPPRRRGGRLSRPSVAIPREAPPRRRGGRGSVRAASCPWRSTPASAGRTSCSECAGCTGEEHPRVGGEDNGAVMVGSNPAGTPPRRRGGRRRDHPAVVRQRNTPASAGSTASWPSMPASPMKHPRVGGEHPIAVCPSRPTREAPPRRRGARSSSRTTCWSR
jgi:hypothetical protein